MTDVLFLLVLEKNCHVCIPDDTVYAPCVGHAGCSCISVYGSAQFDLISLGPIYLGVAYVISKTYVRLLFCASDTLKMYLI